MLVQRISSGGYETYSGAITLAFLRHTFDHSFPEFKRMSLPSLEADAKSIGEIAQFIVHQITCGETWWIGSFSFAVYPSPSFLPLTTGLDKEQDSGVWGQLNLIGEEPEVWFPLEGYQRMLGLLQAISMLPGKERQELENSMISVLLLPDLPVAECHKLLPRLHKSARAIDRGKAIRTIINDDYATYARWIMGEDDKHEGIIKKDLINWKSNTLTNRLERFSTLSVLYDSAKMLDQALPGHIVDKEQRYQEIAHIWTLLLDRFTLFSEGLNSPRDLPRLRAQYLCLKPTGQLIVIAVVALALRTQKEIPLPQVIQRLNEVPWKIDHSYWQNIAVMDGRINGTVATISLTARFVAYLIGLPFSEVEIQKLEEDYCKAKRDKKAALPQLLFPNKSDEE